MSQNARTPSDEIDLISFLQLIGNFFKSIGNGIKKIFVFLFDRLFFSPYVFFYRFKKWLIPLFVVFMLAGVMVDLNKKKLYQAEILVTPFYDSGKELYSRIAYLNNLINENKWKQLSSELKISEKEASELVEFSIEPNFNERINIKYFDEYASFLDTLALENLTYNVFVSSLKTQKFDYPQHKITVYASSDGVFEKLNSYFDTLLEDEPFFSKRKKEFLETQNILLDQYMKSLQQIDSLRNAVNFAIKNLATSQATAGNGVFVGNTTLDFPEEKYNLFEIRKNILREITRIRKSLSEQEEVLLMNSFFPSSGESFNPIKRNYVIVFIFLFWLVLILLGNLSDTVSFMNRRMKEKTGE